MMYIYILLFRDFISSRKGLGAVSKLFSLPIVICRVGFSMILAMIFLVNTSQIFVHIFFNFIQNINIIRYISSILSNSLLLRLKYAFIRYFYVTSDSIYFTFTFVSSDSIDCSSLRSDSSPVFRLPNSHTVSAFFITILPIITQLGCLLLYEFVAN